MNVIHIVDFIMTGVDKVRYLVCTLYHLTRIHSICVLCQNSEVYLQHGVRSVLLLYMFTSTHVNTVFYFQ